MRHNGQAVRLWWRVCWVSLQTAQVKAQTLEANVEKFVAQESKMQQIVRTLEQEKAFYQRSVERLRSRLAPGTVLDVELIAMSSGPNGQLKARPKWLWLRAAALAAQNGR